MSRAARVIVSCWIAFGSTGCIQYVGGTDWAETPGGPVRAEKLRVVYTARHFGKPEEFLPRLEAALSRELGRPVQIERALTDPRFERVEPADPAEVLVEIDDGTQWQCGNPALGAALLSVITFGLLPVEMPPADSRWGTWVTTKSGARSFEFEVHGVAWAWLPLLPLTPLNLAWRKLRGGEEEYFLRVYPGHLHELLSETGDPAAASR